MSTSYRNSSSVLEHTTGPPVLSLPGICAICALLLGISPAWATLTLNVGPGLPASLTVGQTTLAASMGIVNTSNGPDAASSIELTGITLVPSCGTQSPGTTGDCPVASVDPGVLQLSATGLGRAGTGCAGATFSNSVVDQAQGKYQLATSPQVVLGPPTAGAGATCIIDFTINVLKLPTKDAAAGLPDLQTVQVGYAAGFVVASGSVSNTGTGQVTITPPQVNPCLDLDGDGTLDALTDGLMLLRALFGLTGDSVTNGAIGTPTPPRATWAAIRGYMNSNCGTSFAP